MKQFGKIGIMNYRSKDKHKAKNLNQGRACMYLGLVKDRPKDTFRFLNLEVNKVIMSHDVMWMDAVYGNYKRMPESDIACKLIQGVVMMMKLQIMNKTLNQVLTRTNLLD
jgi:hypothetical protein